MYSVAMKDLCFHPTLDTCVLSLPFTKSGTRFNVVESVVLDDPCLVRRLRNQVRTLPGDTLLFPEGSRCFRRLFDELVVLLRLPRALLFKPYSVRRGAATEYFRMSGSLSRTAVRGRWQNEKTCRIYINDSMTMLGDINLSPMSRALVEHFALVADRFFS